jgi:hypothetical protein
MLILTLTHLPPPPCPPRLQPELNPDEVAEIFALPLANFLTSVSPYPPAPASAPAVDASAAGAKAGKPPKPYYSFFDADFVDRRYRRHQCVPYCSKQR